MVGRFALLMTFPMTQLHRKLVIGCFLSYIFAWRCSSDQSPSKEHLSHKVMYIAINLTIWIPGVTLSFKIMSSLHCHSWLPWRMDRKFSRYIKNIHQTLDIVPSTRHLIVQTNHFCLNLLTCSFSVVHWNAALTIRTVRLQKLNLMPHDIAAMR